MILKREELQWVTGRMKIYDIKYQEIFNEIFDHILTAIEVKRAAGDTRSIDIVFQHVVDEHFDGYRGIEELAKQHEKIYKKRIGKSFKSIVAGYFSWPFLIFTVIALVLSFQLPDVKLVHKAFYAAIFLLAFSPLVYTFIVVSKRIKVNSGYKSLLRAHLISYTFLPGMMLNSMLYLPGLLMTVKDKDDKFYAIKYMHVPALMLVLIFFVLANLSCIRLCDQMLDKETV